MRVRRIVELEKIKCKIPDLDIDTGEIVPREVTLKELHDIDIRGLERSFFRYYELEDRECRLGAMQAEELGKCLCNIELDFGKFKGYKLCDIPEWYLEWVFRELGKPSLASLVKTLKEWGVVS